MKKLTLTLVIFITALISQNSDARTPRTVSETIPSVETINKMINYFNGSVGRNATPNFSGMKLLFKERVHGEEVFDYGQVIYGANTIFDKKSRKVVSTGKHACYFEYRYDTNTGFFLGFKERSDRDNFLSNVKKSKYYKKEHDQYTIFNCMFELTQEDGWNIRKEDGWYLIIFGEW